jgi:hypothetical protein
MPPCRRKSGDSTSPAGFPAVTGFIKGYSELYRLDFLGKTFIAFCMVFTYPILKLHDDRLPLGTFHTLSSQDQGGRREDTSVCTVIPVYLFYYRD